MSQVADVLWEVFLQRLKQRFFAWIGVVLGSLGVCYFVAVSLMLIFHPTVINMVWVGLGIVPCGGIVLGGYHLLRWATRQSTIPHYFHYTEADKIQKWLQFLGWE